MCAHGVSSATILVNMTKITTTVEMILKSNFVQYGDAPTHLYIFKNRKSTLNWLRA
ncbi:MAG: hypothetical protein ACJA2O_004683 [Candidatus Azotimanducaceae bacterium]|jgi:hypothetical protein